MVLSRKNCSLFQEKKETNCVCWAADVLLSIMCDAKGRDKKKKSSSGYDKKGVKGKKRGKREREELQESNKRCVFESKEKCALGRVNEQRERKAEPHALRELSTMPTSSLYDSLREPL